MLITRRPPSAAAGSALPCRRLAIARSGDISHSTVSGDTGQTAPIPARGSRMMPLANEEAARFGLPGRTTTVGMRRLRPSTKPCRL